MHKALILAAVVFAATPAAYAVQLDVEITDDRIQPEFRFLRVVSIEHGQGGELADLLQQRAGSEVSFRIDSQNSDVLHLAEILDKNISEELSAARVDGLVLEYRAAISARPHSTTVEYKIDMIPTLSGAEKSGFVDFQWRGFSIDGPVVVQTDHGTYDINSPASAIRVLAPQAYQRLAGTGADEILSLPLLDASGLQTPLTMWHFLFDPIGKLVSGLPTDTVVSQYSLGECRIVDPRICKDKTWSAEAELDKRYQIGATESRDDATVILLGYTRISSIGGIEYFERVGQAVPEPTEDLSVLMMYGMAAIAAVAGGFFFVFSSKKSKREQGLGQTGVDPADLVSYDTSASSGGYHTNRGESVLRASSRKSAV